VVAAVGRGAFGTGPAPSMAPRVRCKIEISTNSDPGQPDQIRAQADPARADGEAGKG